MSIKKQYLKSKPVCKVTLSLPKEAAESAKKVTVVGDFNDWDKKSSTHEETKRRDFQNYN